MTPSDCSSPISMESASVSSGNVSPVSESDNSVPPRPRHLIQNPDDLPLAIEEEHWKNNGHCWCSWLCIFATCSRPVCGKRFTTRSHLRNHVAPLHELFVAWPRAGRPSTREGGPRVQDHNKLNDRVLSLAIKRTYKEFSQTETRWKVAAKKEWVAIEDRAIQRPLPKDPPLLCRVVEPCLQEVLGISNWGSGIIPSKKQADFETHDKVLEELRKCKFRNVKPICDAFKAVNVNILKNSRRGYIADILCYHETCSMDIRIADGKESFIANFVQKKTKEWNMKKASKMNQAETSTVAYKARRRF